MAAARPLVTVFSVEGKGQPEQIKTPSVLLAPIRTDIVQFVHTSMNKNHRQAYAVKDGAGMQHSAESWGTGRAVARIPRVSGGGTSRSGQGAFGNMCRKGRMFAPTRTWRKWHRKINQNQRRYAVASALAASAVPALVAARGHKIEALPEVPLVVDSAAQAVTKTKQAVAILSALGAYADVEKAKESRKLRAGVGKMRNRRHVQRRGPLVVYAADNGITQAFRNLPGVELCHVDCLNLLQLAPGGHVGRLVLWTKDAFTRLDAIWGSQSRESVQKKGYTLPQPMMVQSDLARLINSDEIQSKVKAAKKGSKRAPLKKNPLANLGAMVKLNPYALALRRSELLTQERQAKAKAAAVEAKRKNLAAPALSAAEKAEAKADKTHKKAHQKKKYAALSEEIVAKTLEKKVFRTELPRDPNVKQGRVKIVRIKKAAKGGDKKDKKEGDAKDAKAAGGDKKEEKKEAKAAAKKK